jgi:ABC-type transport system involved in cytochrome bd biosynthesis fused ATPase/permease subunit
MAAQLPLVSFFATANALQFLAHSTTRQIVIMKITLYLAIISAVAAFAPTSTFSGLRVASPAQSSASSLNMALEAGQTPIVIGVAADSGCGKSTFMRRLTSIFGGDTGE